MVLAAGSKLSFYEVLGPLGAGAMGEVYRAKDTRLGREVAIKVLPEHFANDEERLRRFEREAQTLASLNHPNVAQIHGVDQVGDTCFLVLELVPGESLEERLKRGPLPVDEAVDVCRQIAEGLEAAHEAGVIHRDLKPANVRITPDGKVKVLDFGLAKPVNEGHAGSSTDSVLSTEAGRLLGTPTYMAPEQARGKSIDKRVDIWAFGCVLFECLTAKRAFAGDTLTDVFAAVIEREPDWAKLPAATPPRVREFLHYCLAKDPRQRLRDIGELRILVSGQALHRAAQPEFRKSLVLPIALTGALLLALDLGLRRVLRAPAAEVAASSRLMSFSRQTDLPGAETNPDLSPDGNQFVYASRASGNSDIYSLRVGGSRAVDLTEGCSSDDGAPRFSRDGQSLVFRSERDGGGLFVMGATGESVRRLTDRGFDPCWSPDGTQVACATEAVDNPYDRFLISELWIVDVASGAMRRRLAGDAVQPSWSTDGRLIAYWANTGGQRDIWVVAAGSGEPVAITRDAATDWSPEWSPDGRRLYFSSDRGGSQNLWSVGIDPASGQVADSPRPETNGVRSLAFARFSANGKRMLCLAYDRARDILVNVLDPETGVLKPLHEYRRQALEVSSTSPDGQWLIGSTIGAREDILLLRADGGELRKLTNDAWKDRTTFCSPDGKTILFKSTRTGRWQPWSIKLDGSGLTQVGEFDEADVGGWSLDGAKVFLLMKKGASPALVLADPRRLNMLENTQPMILAPELGTLGSWGAGPTPNSVTGMLADTGGGVRQLGILGLESGKFEPFEVEPSGRADQAIAGWLPDGQRIVLRTQQGIVVYDCSTKVSQKVADCTPSDNLVLSRDGRTLVIVRDVYDADVWLGELE